MARKTDTTSVFRLVALLIALSLLVASAMVYFQSRGGGGGVSTELAALSQSIPARSADALSGRAGAFEVLQRDMNRLAELRRAPGVPGRSAEWQQLESRTSAVLARRAAFEGISEIGESTTAILDLSNELLSRSGSTAVIQEFQQRTADIAESATSLTSNTDAAAVLASMGQDAAFLRSVSDALAGADSGLDVLALDEAGQDEVVVPL